MELNQGAAERHHKPYRFDPRAIDRGMSNLQIPNRAVDTVISGFTDNTSTSRPREPAMKTTAISVSRLHLPSRLRVAERLPDFIALTKPRVMLLTVFTALVGLIIAPGHLDLLHAFTAILAIAAGARAEPHRRIRPRGRADAAGRRRKSRNDAANPDL